MIAFNGKIELEPVCLFEMPLPEPAILYDCASLPGRTRSLLLETTCDLPRLVAEARESIDVTEYGALRGDLADAALDIDSIAFALNCHVWSNKSVRATAWNVSASTVDLAALPLSVQVTKRWLT